MIASTPCDVCGNEEAERLSKDPLDTLFQIICPRCGEFEITQDCINQMRTSPYNENRHLISGWIRNHSITSPPLLMSANLEEIVRQAPKSPIEKANILLSYLNKKTSYFGEEIGIEWESDYSICYSKNFNELIRLMEHLEEEGFVKEISKVMNSSSYHVTSSGFSKYELSLKETETSKQCFVAMWFDDSMEEAKTKGIIPAIEKAGYIALVINMKLHNNKICEEIILEIKKSKFIIADVTGSRGGVYFEAGYAKALGKEVIWSCRKDKLKEDAHFDTRQYNHVIWTLPEDLYDKLYNQIIGTIGFGPNKKG